MDEKNIETEFGKAFLDDIMTWFVGWYGPDLPNRVDEEDCEEFSSHFSRPIIQWVKQNIEELTYYLEERKEE